MKKWKDNQKTYPACSKCILACFKTAREEDSECINLHKELEGTVPFNNEQIRYFVNVYQSLQMIQYLSRSDRIILVATPGAVSSTLELAYIEAIRVN